jgi:hypothetical protein
MDLTTKQLYFFGDSLYLLSTRGTWGAAQLEAQSVQGNLVTINDGAEQTFLAGLFPGQNSWIGYTDSGIEGDFQWSNGERSVYTNWATNEPNNFGGSEDFVILGNNGDWNDARGTDTWQGIIEIKNPTTPLLAIEDLSIIEPANGSRQALFTVRRYGDSTNTTTVSYSTADGTTVAGSNYAAASGMLTFSPGETVKTIEVIVSKDADTVSGETFFVNLSNPTNAILADNQAKATLREASEAVTFNGHTYLLTNPGTWGQAQVQAKAFGGNLVTINSAEEQTFLAGQYAGQNLWIGYSDASKEWNPTTKEGFQWVSGTSAYTNWAVTEPNNFGGSEDFAILSRNGSWNDVRGGDFYKGIIEIPKTVNGAVPIPESPPGNPGGNPGGNPDEQDPVTGNPSRNVLVGTNRAETLSGGEGADRFLYGGSSQREALSKSRVRTLDSITDFDRAEGDRIQLNFDNNTSTIELPQKLFYSRVSKGKSLTRALKSVYQDRNNQRGSNQPLNANEAVLLEWQDRTYLTVNDNNRRFSANRDLVVDVTGITGVGLVPGAVQLAVSNYFS